MSSNIYLTFYAQVKFKNLDKVDDLNGLLHKALRQLIRQLDRPQPLDKCGLELRHPSLYPVIIPFKNYADLNTDVTIRLWDEIIQVITVFISFFNLLILSQQKYFPE
jgi:hypothetical protein